MDSKFTEAVIESIELLPSMDKVFPFGFIRVSNNEIDSIYFVALFKDGHEGFIKYDVDGTDWKINSIYYEVDNRIELRFTIDGQLMFKYLHYESDDEIGVIKTKENEYVESYQIKNNDYRKMTEVRDLLVLSNIITKDDDKFKCFDKGNKTYLAVMTQGGQDGFRNR